MINQDINPNFFVEIGRPDFHTKEDRNFYLAIHNFIIESPINIMINSIFWVVDDLLNRGKNYSGGGMKYMFWFETQKDLTEFKEKLQLIP